MRFILFVGILLSFFSSSVNAAEYTYTLSWLEPHKTTYVVALETPAAEGTYTDFAIPAWRPGRYYLQDYAAAISNVIAVDNQGNKLRWEKINKDTWRVYHKGAASSSIKITYHYFANNRDSGSSHYSETQVYFNPINLFMHKAGNYEGSVQLTLPNLDKSWKQATALKQVSAHNVFSASSYHEFADSPTVFSSKMKQWEFEDDGCKILIHIEGNYLGDEEAGEALVEALKKICREQAAIFGGYPMEEFHFIYRLLPYRISHGVEHMFSTLISKPEAATRSARVIVSQFQGTSAHEFWHLWNVKRIRPAALWPYDYSQPQYTGLHWFTEGVTSYYTALTLIRTQLYTEDQFLSLVARDIQSIENNYAGKVVSPYVMSYDSWLSQSPYAIPHNRISYYTAGSRLGMLLDLSIRAKSKGKYSLDDVFRYLFEHHYQKGEGVPEEGIENAIKEISGISFTDFFDRHVRGTEAVDYKKILKPFGLELLKEENANAGKRGLGIVGADNISQGIYITRLHRSGDAFQDGLAEEDLILEVDGQPAANIDFDDYVNGKTKGDVINLQVYRSGQVVNLDIAYKQRFGSYSYKLKRVDDPSKKQDKLYLDWIGTKIK